MKQIKPYKKHIAPRLRSGESREAWGGGLPEGIKYGLYMIARERRQSVSWVIEQIVIEYFELPVPDYIARKPTPAQEARREAKNQEEAESSARRRHRARSAAEAAV